MLFLVFWWLRVTLVAAFGFLPKKIWEGGEVVNGTLPFYECRVSGGDIQRWWRHSNPACCNQIHLNLLHSEVVKMLKHLACAH